MISEREKRFGRSISEDIETFTVRGQPECRAATPPVLVTGIERPFIAKVVVRDQGVFFTAYRTTVCHFLQGDYTVGSIYAGFSYSPIGRNVRFSADQ